MQLRPTSPRSRLICAGLFAASLLLGACNASGKPASAASDLADRALAVGAHFQDNGYWVIPAQGRRDYVAIKQDFSGDSDLLLGIDLDDFMKSGFDPARIDAARWAPAVPVYDLPTSTLLLSFDLGSPAFVFGKQPSASGLEGAAAAARPAPDLAGLLGELFRTLPGLVKDDPASPFWTLELGQVARLAWNRSQAGDGVAAQGPTLRLSLSDQALANAGLEPARLSVWKPASSQGVPVTATWLDLDLGGAGAP